MPIYLYNTLSRKKEKFEPLKEGMVSMYHCGPTVYDRAHIGNLRSFVFADTARRVFEYNGYGVKQVMNITDVGHLTSDADEGEDKMTVALKREGMELSLPNMRALADRYIAAFKEDTNALNIKEPDALPRASDFVEEQVALVKRLDEKGFAYSTQDGVYFDTGKFPDYGKLGGAADEEYSRVGVSEEKKNPQDFVLWKFNEKLGWESPWGKGFPGWHIECSAMSRAHLGQPFDIHTGGVDHIGTHHNNEIAQSEAGYDAPLANYWLHNEFITVDGKKMAKSEGNYLTLDDIVEKIRVNPLSNPRKSAATALRYWFLQAHYRTQANFTWEALEASANALQKLYKSYESYTTDSSASVSVESASVRGHFREAINDNLNTPQALAELWDIVRDKKLDDAEKRALMLDFDRVLGLGFADLKPEPVPEEVQALADEREEARAQENWARADELREKIEERGYKIEDTPAGPRLRRNN